MNSRDLQSHALLDPLFIITISLISITVVIAIIFLFQCQCNGEKTIYIDDYL